MYLMCAFLQVTNDDMSAGLEFSYAAGQALPSDKMVLSKVPSTYGGSYSQDSDSQLITAAPSQVHA